MRNGILKLGFLGLFLFGFSGLLPAEVRYTVTDLGTLGAPYVGAGSINDNGQIVGSLTFANLINHVFLWENGVMIDLGQVQEGDTVAQEINTLGHVVGTALNFNRGGGFGFLYDGTSFSDFGVATSANALNDLDQVVGAIHTQGRSRATIWTNGIAQDLGTLGGFSSSAAGINKAGKVVGWAEIPDALYVYHAFLWDNSQMIDLGTLGGPTSAASDINNLNQIVGSFNTASGKRRPFLWQNGLMVDLGTLDDRSAEAYSLNDLGQIVGEAYGDSSRALLWEGNQLYDLNTLIDPNSGWVLNFATDINNNGQIVGTGFLNGNSRAFLLNPVPEPGALILLGMSAFLVCKHKSARC